MRHAWIVVMLAACFVHRRSDDLTCSTTDPSCPEGRVCQDGFCLPGNAIDAAPDGPQCPMAGPLVRCTSCDLDAMTCEVDCSSAANCFSLVCPAGFACTFNCSKAQACSSIDCSGARSCDIDCTTAQACGNIDCGGGACNVMCSANNACSGGIDCSGSCACDVTCSVGCNGIQCPAGCAGGGSQRCSSGTASCNTCP